MERLLEALELVVDTKESELRNVDGQIKILNSNRESLKVRLNALELSIIGQEKIISELNEKGKSDADPIMVLHRETKQFVKDELIKSKFKDFTLEQTIVDLVLIATDLKMDIKEIKAFIIKERRIM